MIVLLSNGHKVTMLLCPWEDPRYLIFSSNVPDVLYYSHIPAIILALLLGFFVFFNNKTPATKTLLVLVSLFSLYTILDLIIWASNRGDLVLSLWSFQVLIEPFIFLCGLYLTYLFLGQTISSKTRIISLLTTVPFIVLIPTKYDLIGVTLATCDASEGFVALYYSYILETLFTLWVIVLCVKVYRASRDIVDKKRTLFFGIGLTLLLFAFSWGNIVGSFTEDWVIAQYGLFGMPVFIGFLAFLIVRYKAFDIKLVGAQALVTTLIVVIGSQFFFIQNNVNRILTGFSFILIAVFGLILIRSVKQEIKQKEQYEKLSHSLEVANERLKELDSTKSEFISIASHQLRTPLTAIKGYISLLLEGSYGTISAPVLDVLNKLYSVNSRLVHLVEDLLNVSRIEAGRIQYSFAPTQLEPLIAELVDMFKPSAKEKNLTLTMKLQKTPLPLITIDPNKIKEVVSNLIDNAVKYTKVGGVTVSLESTTDMARIIISDTGIGIHEEDKKNLFQKFLRSKETTRMVVSGAGLGLYVGKSFIEAHNGKIWAESDGEGKGSRFIIELPLINPKIHIGTSDQPSYSEKV